MVFFPSLSFARCASSQFSAYSPECALKSIKYHTHNVTKHNKFVRRRASALLTTYKKKTFSKNEKKNLRGNNEQSSEKGNTNNILYRNEFFENVLLFFLLFVGCISTHHCSWWGIFIFECGSHSILMSSSRTIINHKKVYLPRKMGFRTTHRNVNPFNGVSDYDGST